MKKGHTIWHDLWAVYAIYDEILKKQAMHPWKTGVLNFSFKTPAARINIGLMGYASILGNYFGAPEGIWTSDLPLRRRSLYPAELQAHSLIIIVQAMRFVNLNQIPHYEIIMKKAGGYF